MKTLTPSSLALLCILTLGLCAGVVTQSFASPQDSPQGSLKAKEIDKRQGRSSSQLRASDKKTPHSSEAPLPTHKRGFWGTFFFWMGGVFCMYLVGRKVFKEQSHERRTLKRMRDELGHFFPEFDPVNITRWVQLAADHVFYAWREGDFESLQSFSSAEFIKTHHKQVADRRARKEKRSVYLDKVISVHTLGMEWHTRDDITHPPAGVSLTLRVETKAIDFSEDVQGHVISGEKKPAQYQYIWRLIHNGNTWTLSEIYLAEGDITNLNEHPPLPPISQWRHRALNNDETTQHESESTSSSPV